MKKIFCILCVSLVTFFLFAEETAIQSTFQIIPTEELLAGYLERDSDIKNLTIDLQKEKISQQINDVENGFDISLSTGDMTFKFSDTTFSVKPRVEASFPTNTNLKASVSGDLSFNLGDSNGASGESESITNISLKLSTDIISTTALEKEIETLKAQRRILEAERKLKSKALEKEKSFYSEYKTLLNTITSIIKKEQTYYDDKISFEKIKAQGYAKTSSSYRRAEMTVLSDEHEIETTKRNLIIDYKIFYIKCGKRIDIGAADYETLDFIKLVPSDIPEVEPLNVHDFDPANYTGTESAVWTNKINTMDRSTERKFSLTASGGYTFKNSKTSSDTVDVGVDATYGGLTVGAETNVPLSNFKPSVTLSATIRPNTFKKNKLESQKEELTEQQELMSITDAKIDFGTKALEKDLKLADINWERTKNNENLAMYESLENDMLKWYNQGVITESEYLSAKVNRQQASVTKIINLIDMIVYNCEIKTMFVE